MSIRSDYPCNEAINDLEVFFRKHIANAKELQRFLDYLVQFKAAGRVSFRFLHEELMAYRKTNSDYFPFSDEERKMIDELSHFWG